MHPAPSLIVFTSLSGLGFGLLFFLGLGMPEKTGLVAFGLYALGYGLATAGLIASTFHLGRPERAIHAFSQWRSSWLSREAVLALATLLILAPHAAGAVFFATPLPVLGVIGGLLALVTVFSTAMIYASIRAVPRWNHWSVPFLFLTAALAGGALLAGNLFWAAWLMLGFGVALILHWALGDLRFEEAGSTMGTATGLGRIGKVRLFAPPHTGDNYLLHEMAFRVGRKHAGRLRAIALGLGAGVPVALLALLPAGYVVAFLAFAAHLAGLLASRWLFYAQAEHVMALYYGRAPG